VNQQKEDVEQVNNFSFLDEDSCVVENDSMIYCEAGDNITVGMVSDRESIAIDIRHTETKAHRSDDDEKI
jgi:hypothetical protein